MSPAVEETKLVLIRHGQSEWNLQNQFTGWYDSGLTEEGISEAKRAAKLMLYKKLTFDKTYTSVLKRAIHTQWEILKEMNLSWIPSRKAWELNERHYGALQGLNKAETVAKFGELQVKAWRRSYETPPPKLKPDAIPLEEKIKYAKLGLKEIPLGESLEMTQKRVLPFWTEIMVPEIMMGKELLVVAHGNSLRALVMFLEKISSEEITKLEIETGEPIVYTLGPNLKILNKEILKKTIK